MDFIFTYQNELLYSLGAIFAFLSMLSYVFPVFQISFLKKDADMDSSDEFFDGFDKPDFSSITGIEEESDDYDESILVLSEKYGGFSEN